MGGFSFLSDYGQEHFLDRIKLFVKEALPIEKALPVHDGEIRAFHRNGGSDLEPLQVLHEPFVHLRDEDFLRAKFVQEFLPDLGFVEQIKAFAMSFIANDQEARFVRNAAHQPLNLVDAVQLMIDRAGDGQARAHRFEHGGQIGILKVLEENAGGRRPAVHHDNIGILEAMPYRNSGIDLAN